MSRIRPLSGFPELTPEGRVVEPEALTGDAATIAEGVETPAQAATLQALRCPYAQGFLYARPMPADEIDAVLPTIVR